MPRSSHRNLPGNRFAGAATRTWSTVVAVCTVAVAGAFTQPPAPAVDLSFVAVAPGLELAESHDMALIGGAGPIALWVLRADTTRVRLSLALALDRSPALERVPDLAARTGALAAVNAGFFTPDGSPAGVLKVGGRVIGTGRSPRAAIALDERDGRQSLIADQLRAVRLPWTQWSAAGLQPWLVPLGQSALAGWQAARDVIGGAGLLVAAGRPLTNWDVESMRPGFTTERHPRTLIGVDAEGRVWMVAIDGRRPDHSIGMTFADLVSLATRLGLRAAVNLDGGGSTTMVVAGRIVNRPSDLLGPRAVSDAIVVHAR